MAAKPFRDYLKDLAAEHETSVSRALQQASDYKVKGLALDTLKKAVAADRPISSLQIKAIVEALGVDPEEVPHYRMAKIREDLDERTQGAEHAFETLRRLEAAQQQSKREGREDFLRLAEEEGRRRSEQPAPSGASSRSRDAKDRRS